MYGTSQDLILAKQSKMSRVFDQGGHIVSPSNPVKKLTTKTKILNIDSGDRDVLKYASNGGTDFPYAPPSFQNDAHEIKLNQILRMIEQNKVGYEQPASQDMMLYIFTGIVFLFTLDTFVKLGKRMK